MLIHLTSNFFLLEYFEFISNPNIILNYHLPVAICSFTLAMKSFILTGIRIMHINHSIFTSSLEDLIPAMYLYL